MIPTSFDESNAVLSKPADMTHEDCECLSVWVGRYADGGPAIVSCWKLTREELEQINRTGRVWLHVFGPAMPPVALETKHPFKETT